MGRTFPAHRNRPSGASFLRLLAALFLLAATLGAARPALAKDLIIDRGWFEDPTGQLTLEQVRQQPLKPFRGVLSQGYGASALWIRLRLAPTAGEPGGSGTPLPVVLRMRPVYLDDLQVFDPDATPPLQAVTGDRHHPRLDARRTLDFQVALAPVSGVRDVWVRLESTSTRQVEAQVLQPEDLRISSLVESLVVGLYVGLVLALLAWGLVSSALTRETLVAVFAVKQGAALLFALSSFGVLRVFWPGDWSAGLLDSLGSVFSIVAVGTAIFFHVRFVGEFMPARWASWLLHGALGLTPLCLALLALGWTSAALEANMLAILVTPFLALACVLTGKAWSQPDHLLHPLLPRPLVIGFYLLLLGFMGMAAVSALALAQGNLAAIYVSQLHGLVTGILLLVMLQLRAHKQQQQRRQVMLDLVRSRLQARHELESRQEQEKLLAMLAHEIKTPLATMQMRLDPQAAGSREMRQAIADMNGIIERCLQASRLGEGQLQARMQPHDLVHLARDVIAATPHPQRIRLQAPDKLIAATDRQLLYVVLGNLLDNALKYSPPDATIDFQIRESLQDAPGPGIHLAVANPPGVAGWPDAGRLFQKYYRAPHAQRQAGTGLGLYLVRSLVQTLGGSIHYDPEADRVRMIVRLPPAAGA